MNYQTRYRQWLGFDEATKSELQAISDEKEIEDRFYKDLIFGTGGLRGVMGAGTNRMNTYTVKRATLGIARFLRSTKAKGGQIVIAYDSRHQSRQFAENIAEVFCASGIQAYLFDTLVPTPVLSYAVKALVCDLGIVVTASHNPKEYNGYKVYDEHGCQLIPTIADEVIRFVQGVTDYVGIPSMLLSTAADEGLFHTIGNDISGRFIEAVNTQSTQSRERNLKIVYTPLHGSGNIPVRAVLQDFDVSVVPEQELPDGDFPTVSSPNPENRTALTMALTQARLVNADLVLGTDPDCDRVGAGVRHHDDYVLLTGNQIGALLVQYILQTRTVNKRSTIVKTIVTNDLGADIGRKRGLQIVNTLTGFKYIGDRITAFESDDQHEFLIGYEESYGYLVGTHARDKDAVVASMLIAEMASFYKRKNKTLVDVLEDLYNEFGYYLDHLESFTFSGVEGARKIQCMMDLLRNSGADLIPEVVIVEDYAEGIQGLPQENVLKFIMADGSWFAVRPSGTEPKIKIYYSIKGENRIEAVKSFDALHNMIKESLQL